MPLGNSLVVFAQPLPSVHHQASQVPQDPAGVAQLLVELQQTLKAVHQLVKLLELRQQKQCANQRPPNLWAAWLLCSLVMLCSSQLSGKYTLLLISAQPGPTTMHA